MTNERLKMDVLESEELTHLITELIMDNDKFDAKRS